MVWKFLTSFSRYFFSTGRHSTLRFFDGAALLFDGAALRFFCDCKPKTSQNNQKRHKTTKNVTNLQFHHELINLVIRHCDYFPKSLKRTVLPLNTTHRATHWVRARNFQRKFHSVSLRLPFPWPFSCNWWPSSGLHHVACLIHHNTLRKTRQGL